MGLGLVRTVNGIRRAKVKAMLAPPLFGPGSPSISRSMTPPSPRNKEKFYLQTGTHA